ncbi:MAG: NFACT family protein [Bacilli bacterium]
MPIDGVFIHFLVSELNASILGERIHKFLNLNPTDFILYLSSKKRLLISLDANHPHLRLTNFEAMGQPNHLSSFLKKHIEGSIIHDITQYNNDRMVTIGLEKRDELGYLHRLHLILELIGRSCNMIFTDENNIILESYKRSYITDERIITPRATYTYLESHQYNPFTLKEIKLPLEGMSRVLMAEVDELGCLDFIQQAHLSPTLIEWDQGSYFHAFDLPSLVGKRTQFSTLSALLETVLTTKQQTSQLQNDEKRLEQAIQRELKKTQGKLQKQLQEWETAKANLILRETANVLSSNLHLVKKYQSEITVFNFYTNQNITIPLDPKKTPSDNVNYLFTKYKKAKRTIDTLSKMMEETQSRILYLQTLLRQTAHATISDLKEIIQEMHPPKGRSGKAKPQYLTYQDENNNLYFVGKNNIQNNYVTHTLAKSKDIFFHVVAYPGSHVILRGSLTLKSIENGATLAAFYSKVQGVCAVDYTLIKYVKKVKGQPGSFVTYTNQKQTHATGDEAIFQKLTLITSHKES